MEGSQVKKQPKGFAVIAIVIAAVLVFLTAGVAAGMTLSTVKNNTGDLPAGYSGGGSQFQVVKTMDVEITQYSPNMAGNKYADGRACDPSTGGGAGTADGQGQFRIKDGKVRWVFNDLVKYEDYVFAEPTDYSVIPWGQRNQLAVVVPGFKGNLPIHVRDTYAVGNHVGKAFLDLFAPCAEYKQVSSELSALPHKNGQEGGSVISVQIVDTTKPINGANWAGKFYHPLGGFANTVTRENSTPHTVAATGHGVFPVKNIISGFSDVEDGAVDLNVENGSKTPVFAAFDGKVVHTNPQSEATYGNRGGVMWIESTDGNNAAAYAHIEFLPNIKEGTQVRKSEQIGMIAAHCGSSKANPNQCVGFNGSEHLHFQIYVNKVGTPHSKIKALFN
jgi:hypothetical protein